MREGEWGNPDCIGRECPTQPREGRSMSVMSDKEIRNKLLESDDPKGWKYSIGEQMRDSLTNDQAAMLAYYYYRAAKYMRDENSMHWLAGYFMEIMGSVIEKTMEWEIEKYKENNAINDEQDDCSAYKEDRDLNPEKYT